MVPAPPELLARLRAVPAGGRLLAVLDERGAEPLEQVWLVGGAVRDLALGRRPGELDLVVAGDARAVAAELGRRLQGAGRAHEPFGTHTVEAGDLRVDVAMARTETYPEPGRLPVVEPAGDVAADLVRRDFTINALALGVSADVRGELVGAPRAAEDLDARLLRVLHERSFLDDPTRLLRLARYAARLGFAIEPGTERLARAAFAAGAPATAGVARMGNELMLLLAEAPDVAIAGLALLRDLAGEGGLDPGLEADGGLLRRVAALAPADARADLALLAAAARRVEPAHLHAWLQGMHLRSADLATVREAAADPEGLAEAMRAAHSASALHRLLRHRTAEAVAVAGAVGAGEPARRWLDDLRHRRLRISGADLVRSGVAPGPEVGRRLAAALERKLDGDLPTRDDELRAALDDG